MALSVHDSTKKARFSAQSALSRWLQEILDHQFDADEIATKNLPLKALHTFCKGADDLPRAFWLAVVCRQSVYQVSKAKEEKTYGKVLADACGEFFFTLFVCRACECFYWSNSLPYFIPNSVQVGRIIASASSCSVCITSIEWCSTWSMPCFNRKHRRGRKFFDL